MLAGVSYMASVNSLANCTQSSCSKFIFNGFIYNKIVHRLINSKLLHSNAQSKLGILFYQGVLRLCKGCVLSFPCQSGFRNVITGNLPISSGIKPNALDPQEICIATSCAVHFHVFVPVSISNGM